MKFIIIDDLHVYYPGNKNSIFFILLKPFFDLWSCQLESSTQHLILSPPLECVENDSYQVE